MCSPHGNALPIKALSFLDKEWDLLLAGGTDVPPAHCRLFFVEIFQHIPVFFHDHPAFEFHGLSEHAIIQGKIF